MSEVCPDGVCVTCADYAVPALVVGLLPGEFALVEPSPGAPPEEISVALVDAAVGDVVLVHAREAIALADRGFL